MATKTATKTAALKKAPEASTTAVAVKKTNTNIVSIQDQLKKQAAEMQDRTSPATGNKIRVTQDKKILFPDGTELADDDTFEVVIVDFVTKHSFYEGKYDPKNITPPACFALGLNPRDMTPSANSPNKQNDSCQSCLMNEYGSDGNGKACKNARLLAVLPPDANADTPLWLLEVSPTALKGFDGYVQNVTRVFGTPPVSVVTTVSLDPNVTYGKLMFSNPQPNTNLEACFARQNEARQLLMTEPDVSNYEKPVKAPARKAAVARR